MSTQVAHDVVRDPKGDPFLISTIRTVAGGGVDASFGPFSVSDYVGETPWPFETMVFREGSRKGLYHAAYATEAEALAGHAQMIDTIKRGLEFGGGVKGPFGLPSLTPEEWFDRIKMRRAV